MKKSKKTALVIILIIAIVAAILIIEPIKNKNPISEEEMKCIAEKSRLYVSKTCGHCAAQKQMLEPYLELFDIIDCAETAEICSKNGIMYVPTWNIKNKKYTGVHALKELKLLANC